MSKFVQFCADHWSYVKWYIFMVIGGVALTALLLWSLGDI